MPSFTNEIESEETRAIHPDNGDVAKFLSADGIVALTRQFEDGLAKRQVDVGLNSFVLVSDQYHKENFHSDILHMLLDPKGPHRSGPTFLRLFVRFLAATGANLDPSNYENAIVEPRESYHIDILIKDEVSQRAIIIENKINGAGDTRRQLITYLNRLKDAGYTCDAIVYLRLYGHSDPDTTAWLQDEVRQVKKLLQVIGAYDDTGRDLVDGWLNQCIVAAGISDAGYLITHYRTLLRKLGADIMNKPVMDDFYKLMLNDDTFRTAQLVCSMLDKLALYRKERLIEHFKGKSDPFNRLNSSYKDYLLLFMDCFVGQAHLGIDILFGPTSYDFVFWDRNGGEQKNAESLIDAMGCRGEYGRDESGRFVKSFAFPSQEEQLVEHIRTFNGKLAEAISTLGTDAN